VVEHDDGAPAGPEHAVDFAHGALGVGRVVQDAVRVDEIKRAVREIQILRVGRAELAGQVLQLEVAPRERDRRFGEIDARVDGARAREPRAVRPQPAPDL
jgi:hypothetical protein